MTGRAFGWGGPGVGWVDLGEVEAPGSDMLQSGYSPWTGKWFRDPPADRPFATDVDGTIILHPSQWKVIG